MSKANPDEQHIKGSICMKISTRSRYATRALVAIALNSENGPVALKKIAEIDCISIMYLQKLATPLISGGILNATRGMNGGVWLAKPAGEIKLSEVVNLLEGSVAPVDCLQEHSDCQRLSYCVAREIWLELKQAMDDVLENTTIGDLVEKQRRNDTAHKDVLNKKDRNKEHS
ncbi:MAG: Rrf2 family transcriptional regulator [Dehalococcoidales bacterium]|nr:Rrf2 family transcriptional regulator [Dehalococcoidales bacterium]